MILFQKLITSEDDVEEAIKIAASRQPAIFLGLGEQGIARYRQNLINSIGEKADTEVVVDPFLAAAIPILEKAAITNKNRRLTSWTNTTLATRGFYTRKYPNFLSNDRCDYFAAWITEWNTKTQDELEKEYAINNGPFIAERYLGTGKVPKKVKLNKNRVLGLYMQWRKQGRGKEEHPLKKLCGNLVQYGTNTDILIGLIQGYSLLVDETRFKREPSTHQLPLCDFKQSQTDSPYVPGTLLEVVFDKIRPDDAAERLMFKARTDIGKHIRWYSLTGLLLHKIIGVEKDEENEIYYRLEGNTAETARMPLGKDEEKPVLVPRYIARGFYIQVPPGSKNRKLVASSKGSRALKHALRIEELRLTPDQNLQVVVRTRLDGVTYLCLKDGYTAVNKPKPILGLRLGVEERWQQAIGKRQHPPKPIKKPKAKYPFGSPDEVFARTPAQARAADGVRTPLETPPPAP